MTKEELIEAARQLPLDELLRLKIVMLMMLDRDNGQVVISDEQLSRLQHAVDDYHPDSDMSLEEFKEKLYLEHGIEKSKNG